MGVWIKRAFIGKRLEGLDGQIESPSRLLKENFFAKKSAVAALAVLAALFPAVTFAVLAVWGFRALWRRARSAAAARFDNAVERHKEKRLSRLAAKDTEGE